MWLLTSKVKEQEQIILVFEKSRPELDQFSGIVIKYRDVRQRLAGGGSLLVPMDTYFPRKVIQASEQTLKLHEENERLNTIVLNQTR